MNAKKIKELIEKKEARKAELVKKSNASEDANELRGINKELEDLNSEISELRSLMDEIEQIEQNEDMEQGEQRGEQRQPKGKLNMLDMYGARDDQEAEKRDAKQKKAIEASEKRGKDLQEKRSVTIGATDIVLPKHQGTNINPTFNEVSSLIDRVTSLDLPGGESYEEPYQLGYGEGDYTDEGSDYKDATPTFGHASMGKAKITAYAEDSEEVVKLPAANYDNVVMNGMSVSVRKKITKEILVGSGATNHLAGIFSAAATAIDADSDISIAEINEDTLDEIIYAFGGDEDVEDIATLILNKKDLKGFATLRGNDGKKIYDVKSKGNTGTIDGIPYLINSACKAISDSANTAGVYSMAYGPLSNYKLVTFSPLEVARSTDYKFKQGMIAHKGVGFFGGNVVAKNGFLRVKKG